jgi:peptidoglycan/LPS O-acetylase OafA/YrhL
MSESDRRIPSLDGLRAVSILLVLCGHSYATMPASIRPTGLTAILFHNTSVGVEMFFFISGYLITQLLVRESDAYGRVDLKAFYLRRALRIFPVFYAYIAVMGVLTATGVLKMAASQFVSAGSFLWNYKQLMLGVGQDEGEWYFGHFWSLSLEEQFYLIWPASLILLGFPRSGRVCLWLLPCFPVIRVLTYATVPAARPVISIMFHTAADPIVGGCLLALAPRIWPGSRWLRIPCKPAVAMASAFLLLLTPWLRHRFTGNYFCTVGPSLETAAMWTLVSWLVVNPTSAPGRFLDSRPMTWVGRLSYSLYVWNQPFLTTSNRTWSGVFPLNLVCNFAVAWVSQQLLEKPFLRWRARLRPGRVVAGQGNEGKR